MRNSIKALSCAVAAALLLTGCWPVPPPDDAGAAAFYDQFLPLVLGRRARNAQEKKYLVDIEALHGRQVVMDLLMGEPEFVEIWKDNLLRHIQLQRDGNRAQSSDCFGELMRLPEGGDEGELASFIRDNPVTSNYPGTNVFSNSNPGAVAVPDDPFNLADVIHSAIELDDLSVVYKAYVVPLVVADGLLGAEEVGKSFNRAFLHRNLDCTECHNVAGSSGAVIFPIPIDLEPQVFGCTVCGGPGFDQSEIWSVFRQDVTGDDAPGGQPTIRPWGLHPSCGTVGTEFTDGSQPTVFAGLDGGYVGLTHLVDQFSAGVESIRSGGLSFSGGTYQPQELPPAQSLVYMVSAKIVEDVWEDLLGSPLTEAHYFARNEDQRDMHRFLTESFIGSDWSLKELISLIMVTGYPNRRAPAQSLQASTSVLSPIFDAFAGVTNGQGELVFRYPPHGLFSQLRHSLGWPRWKAFPDEEDYPNLDLNRDLEQYLSDSSAGTRDWGFQSFLAWEATVASCENPGGGSDWIDRLVQSVADFDADHPDDPLTVRDVVRTVKDRLIGDARISNGPGVDIDDYESPGGGICCAPEPPGDYENPGGGDEDPPGEWTPLPPLDAETEVEGLEFLFGTGLHNPVSSVADLDLKLRRLCGTLLKSPQRTLAGIVDREAVNDTVVPRLLVGNAGEPTTYQQICQSYRPGLAALGHEVSCGPGGVSGALGKAVEPSPLDPARREDATKRVRNFLASIEEQSRNVPFLDPRTGGPLPEEDLEVLLGWSESLTPEQLVDKIPPALLYGAPPDAESFDRMLQEARRALAHCESDADGDGICDAVDPCLSYPNRLPLVDTNKDGLPDECQCGDANGSGSFEAADVRIASDCALTDPAAARISSCVLGIALGDANGSGRFEKEDSSLISGVLSGKTPAHSLRCALRPEGTPPSTASR
ncbi:MAG TPA: hypothetical protein VJ921_01035 [Vicinamibacteria bacterium]|nr:hypothetical protein [Vicinamibacteria bacterium]